MDGIKQREQNILYTNVMFLTYSNFLVEGMPLNIAC